MYFGASIEKKNEIPVLLERNDPRISVCRTASYGVLWGGSLLSCVLPLHLGIIGNSLLTLLCIGYGTLLATYALYLFISMFVNRYTFRQIVRRQDESLILSATGFRYEYRDKDLWYSNVVSFDDINIAEYDAEIRLLTITGKIMEFVSETEDFQDAEFIDEPCFLLLFDVFDRPICDEIKKASMNYVVRKG